MRFCYVKSLYFRYISKIKKFRTKNPGLESFLYGIHRFWTIYTKLTFQLVLKAMNRCGDAAAAVDESITGEGIHGHDGCIT